jgi:hypothetical protein
MSIIQTQLLSPADVRSANQYVSAVDTSIPIRIRYVGPEQTGTVQVAVTTADMLFAEGDVGSTAADASILDAGGTPGTIDISDALANTWCEIVDIINGDPDGRWQAVLIDALRSDVPTAAGIATLAATDAKLKDGLALNWDDSVELSGGRLVAPDEFRDSIQPYLFEDKNGVVRANPAKLFAGFKTSVDYLSVTLDSSAAGVLSLQGEAFSSNEYDATGTDEVMFTNATVDATFEAHDFRAAPIVSKKGQRVIARVASAGDYTALTMSVNAKQERALA